MVTYTHTHAYTSHTHIHYTRLKLKSLSSRIARKHKIYWKFDLNLKITFSINIRLLLLLLFFFLPCLNVQHNNLYVRGMCGTVVSYFLEVLNSFRLCACVVWLYTISNKIYILIIFVYQKTIWKTSELFKN